MNILIVEDELLIAEMLKEMLQDLGHHIIGVAKDYNRALQALENNTTIDFCFLDINLNSDKTGLDIANLINEKYKISFCFLTSYSDKMTITNALEYKPQAYLIKPFTEIDLYTTIELIKSRQQVSALPQEPEVVLIKDGAKIIKLSVAEILWLKSDNIYVEIKTLTKTHLIRTSLVQLLEELETNNIERVHRTFAVNIKNVHAITGQYLVIGETKIPLSRKYREEIMTKFQ
jgi:two-component system, LytTR family, response regulator LytT